MRICRVMVLVGLAMMVAVSAVDAANLRTAPFAGYTVLSGTATCAITNTGTTSGTVSATMYDNFGNVLGNLDPVDPATLPPNVTVITAYFDLSVASPTYCKCVVPNANYRCAFHYVSADGTSVTVVTPP